METKQLDKAYLNALIDNGDFPTVFEQISLYFQSYPTLNMLRELRDGYMFDGDTKIAEKLKFLISNLLPYMMENNEVEDTNNVEQGDSKAQGLLVLAGLWKGRNMDAKKLREEAWQGKGKS